MKKIYLVTATIQGTKFQVYTFGAYESSDTAIEIKDKLYKTRKIKAEIKILFLNDEKDVYIGGN